MKNHRISVLDRVAGLRSFAGLAVAMASAAGAHAQTLSWSNAAGGAASTAGNWSPAAVPGAANTLVFNLAGSYPITFNSSTTQSNAMTFMRGVQTLTMSSPHTTGVVTIGNANAAVGSALLTTGTWNTSTVTLGSVFGSTGSLGVNDDDAVLDCGTLSVAGNTNQLCTLNITGSGKVLSGSVVIGQTNPVGEGRVTVSGQTQIVPVKRSTLDATGSVTVGQSGIGSLTVSNGGLVTMSGNMTVAERVTNPGAILSSGTVTVGGLGLLLPATVSVGGTLKIGRGSLASSDTGDGAMTINDDGAVTVAGATTVGGSGLGSGVLTVNQGGVFTTHGMSFGTSGDLVHNGGTVHVIGGTYSHDDPQLVINGAAAADTPVLRFSAGASGAVNGGLIVGNTRSGELQLDGATLSAPVQGTGFAVGQSAGAHGILTLTNGASLDATPNVLGAGVAGDADITVSGGARLRCSEIHIATVVGSDSTVTVDGAGSRLENAANLGTAVAGGHGAGNGGVGRLVVTNGGTFVSEHIPLLIRPSGTLTVSRGTVDLQLFADLIVNGGFSMTAGTINAHDFTLNSNASASGTIHAKIRQDSPATLTASGDLILGDGAIDGYQGVPLNVGAFRVETHDADDTLLGNTTINGGILLATDAFDLPAGKTLSGTGTVFGQMINHGTITATGGNGLVLAGTVTGIGQGIGGTRITFPSGSGFVGAGNIPAAVVAQPGSRLEFSGLSTIGNGSTTGFICDGELDVTSGLTVNDSNGIVLGALTQLNEAVLRCDGGMVISSGTPATVKGVGALAGDTTNLGVISPGAVSVNPIGQITVSGAYNQFSGNQAGLLELDLLGPASNQADLLLVQGPAQLGGTLNLRLIGGFSPANGFTRTIVRAITLQGTFATEILPPRFHLEYTPTRVNAVFCAADFNNDGFVDFFDSDAYVEAFEAGEPDADFNGDGFIDFFDLDEFVAAFEAGC